MSSWFPGFPRPRFEPREPGSIHRFSKVRNWRSSISEILHAALAFQGSPEGENQGMEKTNTPPRTRFGQGAENPEVLSSFTVIAHDSLCSTANTAASEGHLVTVLSCPGFSSANGD